MKRFLVIVIFFNIGCNFQSYPNQNIDFDNFIKSIPSLPLPYNTDCESFSQIETINIDSALSDKFILDQNEPVGIIGVTKEYIAILYAGKAETLLPVIRVYDRTGNILSEESFFGDKCGQILEYHAKQNLSISNKLEITEIDTVLMFKMDSTYSTILDTLKEYKVSNYWIENNGIITKK